MYRRAGNLARTSLSSKGKEKEDARNKSAKIVSAITRQKENERFNRIGQSPAHNEEFVDENRMASRMEKMPSPPAKVGKATHSIKDLAPSKEPTPEEKAKARKALGLGEGMHKDAETGEVVSKAVPGKTYYPAQPMKKTSVAIEKEKKQKNEEYGGGMKKGGSYDKGYAAMQKQVEKLDKGEEPATAKRYREMKKEELELDEKTLTSAETAKKEQIVKSMKKNFAGFKSSYGKDAKSVMYATATKQAKKVAEGTADDALAMVRASIAKKHGAASIVGSPENKAAQAAQKKPIEQPKRKLSSYSIPGAPKEKSYND
jgi:hypothetical protein